MATVNRVDVQTFHWDDRRYRRIERARYEAETHEFIVEFADGSVARLDPTPLLPTGTNDIDWWRVAANQIEIIVPHSTGWFEIPWDVIRRETDVEYAAHWEAATARLRVHAGGGAAAVPDGPIS